jgi:hypothetical protein
MAKSFKEIITEARRRANLGNMRHAIDGLLDAVELLEKNSRAAACVCKTAVTTPEAVPAQVRKVFTVDTSRVSGAAVEKAIKTLMDKPAKLDISPKDNVVPVKRGRGRPKKSI